MMSEASKFDLNTSAGGRGFIANLFVTVLRRHDFTTYIKERLAADFACTLSKFVACAQAREADLHSDFDRVTAERDALQQRLNTADQRIDELTQGHGEQVALVPVERSYDVRAQMILAFNTSRQAGEDLDDALGAAYKAALRYTPHPGRAPARVASRDDSIAWLKRIDGIGQNRAELIYSMGFRRHTEPGE